MSNILEVQEGAQVQTSSETLTWTITTTNWAGTPTSPTVVSYDEDDDGDVTSTVMPSGSHTVSGDVITLKPLTALTIGHSYRVEVKFTIGSNIWECYFRVRCPR